MFRAQEIHAVAPSQLERVPLYRFEAQLDLKTVGVVPEGLRMANAFEGRITQGLLCGARVWGIDHFVVRSDGIGLISAEKTLSLGDVHVYERVQAYAWPPAGLALPPLQAMTQSGFEWPDVRFFMRGFSFFRADQPELRYLNRELACVEGSGNFRSGALRIETFLLPSADSAAHGGAKRRP